MAVRIALVTQDLGTTYSIVEVTPRKGERVALRGYDDKTHHYRVRDVAHVFLQVSEDQDKGALHSEVILFLEGV